LLGGGGKLGVCGTGLKSVEWGVGSEVGARGEEVEGPSWKDL